MHNYIMYSTKHTAFARKITKIKMVRRIIEYYLLTVKRTKYIQIFVKFKIYLFIYNRVYPIKQDYVQNYIYYFCRLKLHNAILDFVYEINMRKKYEKNISLS